MSNFLDHIKVKKQAEVARLKALYAEKDLFDLIQSRNELLSGEVSAFANSLRRQGSAALNIIAEIKPRSPSQVNFQFSAKDNDKVVKLALDYQAGGARALSVLTDEEYFGGSYDFLKEISSVVALPVLQKEFIIDDFQLLLGRARGASAALILTHYFSTSELRSIVIKALELGLEPVVECSIPEEIERALSANPRVLLLNNRPISLLPEDPSKAYLEGSIDNARRFWEENVLVREFKQDPKNVLISASCVRSAHDISILSKLPFDAALVGNSASESSDPSQFIRELVSTAL